MSFRITGIDPTPFTSLYGLDDAQLAKRGVIRVIADNDTGYPERIELRNARRGEALLLLNHTHQPADSPYRSSHAIFIREGATEACALSDEVPEVLRTRTLPVITSARRQTRAPHGFGHFLTELDAATA